MEQNIVTLNVLKDIFEHWAQKLILKMSASLDGLDPNYVMEEKQILQGKTNIDLKVDFKMIGYNDMGKKYTGCIKENGQCFNNEKGYINN